jgi:signal transduction histidine kinase
MAYFYLSKHELDSAEVNAQRAIEISKAAGEKYLTSFAKQVLGDASLARKDYRKALRLYKEGLAISEDIKNNFLKASTLLSMAITHNALGETETALKYLLEDVQIARAEGFREELEDAYKELSQIYYKRDDLKNAFLYQAKYIDVHDTIVNEKYGERLALMQTAFETEIKQAQIELLTKDATLKAEVITHQRVWTYFYVGGLLLFAVFIFALVYANMNTNRARRLLEEKNLEIEKKSSELRDLNSTKDKLFSIISHDLRSPIASLRGLTEIVAKAGLSQEEFSQLAATLKRNLDSVYDDLDILLLWARSQLNGLHASPENVDVRKVAMEKIELFKDQAENKGIVLVNEISESTFVHADKNHVHLVLRNLIANAIKFSKSGGEVRLTAAERDGYFQISVVDSGIGLSFEDIQKLFNVITHFTRPGTNQEKGMGLGLMLSKEFVESNSGKIWVTSELGQGATFSFTLKAGELPSLD